MPERIERTSVTLDNDGLRLVYVQEGEGKGEYSAELCIFIEDQYVRMIFQPGPHAKNAYQALQHSHVVIKELQSEGETRISEG